MGRGNPNSRAYPVPTMVSNRDDNREYFGGNSKAGIGGFTGYGVGAHNAIVHGSGGHTASRIAGPNFPVLGQLNLIPKAKDLLGKPIKSFDGKHFLYYPINFNNQLTGVSNPSSLRAPTRAPADGVNLMARRAAAKRVASWNIYGVARPMRGTPTLLMANPLFF